MLHLVIGKREIRLLVFFVFTGVDDAARKAGDERRVLAALGVGWLIVVLGDQARSKKKNCTT